MRNFKTLVDLSYFARIYEIALSQQFVMDKILEVYLLAFY